MTIERWLSAGGLLVSILALITSIWSAASIAAITEQEFNQRLFSDLRPWVSIKPIVKSISMSGGSVDRVEIAYEMRNHGKAPALKVAIINGISASSSFYSYDDPQIKCRKLHDELYSLGSDDIVLLPEEEVEVSTYPSKSGVLAGTSVHLVGCVDYQTGIDKSHHQTGFAYDISVAKSLGYSFSGTINSSDISVSHNQFSNSAKAD